MPPRTWLLAYVAACPERPVDPLRLQKGLFLVAMRGLAPRVDHYAFEPYAYGPMSRAIYADVRSLIASGHLVAYENPGVRWTPVKITELGLAAARGSRRVGSEARTEVASLRQQLDALSFRDLLRLVYREHPEYAVRSVFRG